jgi:hypothetical protein
MQKFYTDKAKIFECNVSVDGAKISDTKARLVLEFGNNRNLLFHGNIKSDGKCEITVPALKEMEEGEGTAKLEIIAESTFFESWKDKFVLDTNKKVTVEMVEEDEKEVIDEEKISANVKVMTKEEDKEPIVEETKKDDLAEFKEFAKKNKVNLNEAVKDKQKYLDLLVKYKKEKNLKKEDVMKLHDKMVDKHKKHLV